jgi:hypothetical protein
MNILEHYKAGSSERELAWDVLRMLQKQGSRAFNEREDACMYFDPSSGNKCAVGMLLPDAKVAFDVKGTVGTLYFDLSIRKEQGREVGDLDELAIALGHYDEVLVKLQQFHDNRASKWRLDGLLPKELIAEVWQTLWSDGESTANNELLNKLS